MAEAKFSRDVCVIGGGGHVGLPLALTFADTGLKTVIYDINKQTVESIARGEMPFVEEGGEEILHRVLKNKTLEVCDTPELLSDCRFLVLIVGTPVDEHLNPHFRAIHRAIDQCGDYLRDGQVLVLRSTLFPGISKAIQKHVHDKGLKIHVAFCPERVAQGYSIREFHELPQIISAFDRQDAEGTCASCSARFVTREFVEMSADGGGAVQAHDQRLAVSPVRGTVNQFYMIASASTGWISSGSCTAAGFNYPRMAGMPGPGFRGGAVPGERHDAARRVQPEPFCARPLGHARQRGAAGAPGRRLAKRDQVDSDAGDVVGILGHGVQRRKRRFGAIRWRISSGSCCRWRPMRVLCTDPYVKDPTLLAAGDACWGQSDVLFVADAAPGLSRVERSRRGRS